MIDSVVQACLVGTFVSLAGAGISLYLWLQDRSERFLVFWTLAWFAGFIRWALHIPSPHVEPLRVVEGPVIAAILLCMTLGSCYLLPKKPGRVRRALIITSAAMVGYVLLG